MTLARRDWLALGGIVGLAVGLPLIFGLAWNALDIPHTTTSTIARSRSASGATGTLEMRNFSVMSLIGQILFVQPFLWALRWRAVHLPPRETGVLHPRGPGERLCRLWPIFFPADPRGRSSPPSLPGLASSTQPRP